MQIRTATASDAAACAAVYAPFVRDTAVTFELDPPDAAEFERRIATAQRAHDWLVAEGETGADADSTVLGYAYGGVFKERAAYRFACEVSIYLATPARGVGVGRALYEALFARLAELGYRVAVAGMTLPNPASEALHRALGFEAVGVYRNIGWKQDAWHDVAWVQRPLVEAGGDPSADPR